MTRLVCCSGLEAERFNRTLRHATVQCYVCLRPFCLDARDVEAELRHRPTRYEPDQGSRRRWYCSNDCLNDGRQAIGVNPSEATQEARRRNAAKAIAARHPALPGTEPREDVQERLLP